MHTLSEQEDKYNTELEHLKQDNLMPVFPQGLVHVLGNYLEQWFMVLCTLNWSFPAEKRQSVNPKDFNP